MTKLPWLTIAVLPVLIYASPPAQRYSTGLGLVATALGVAVDSAGFAFATGLTHPAFKPPCTLPILGPADSKGPYGYITKIAPDGAVVWTACLAVPSGRAIAIDNAGAIYAAGGTTVSKISPDGGKILASITIASADIYAIALDKVGNVYVGGLAQDGLVTTPGAFLRACTLNVPCPGGFLAKFDATGKVLYATYSGNGTINSIAADSHGSAWTTGTGSSLVPGARFASSFISRFDPDGANVSFSSGYGGDLAFKNWTSASGLGITIDSNDNAYAVGWRDIPGSVLDRHGYLLKIDLAGNSTYTDLGTNVLPTSVSLDSGGRIYVGMWQSSHSGAVMDCGGAVTPSSLTVYSSGGSTVLNSAFLSMTPWAVAVDGGGNVYVVGGSNGFSATSYDMTENPAIHLDCLVNAASSPTGDGAVAGGEIISLFGKGFTPGPQLTVAFDGYPAPILYSSSTQINAVVPFKLEPAQGAVLLTIQNGSQEIGPFALRLAASMPRLFTIGGTQQVVALNQDGRVNSSSNPAAAGSVISVFLSGAGLFDLPLNDGQLGPLIPPFPIPVAGPVKVSVGDSREDALFAAQAPGQVAGLVQVNLRVPDRTPAGKTRIFLSLGDYTYTAGPTFIEVR